MRGGQAFSAILRSLYVISGAVGSQQRFPPGADMAVPENTHCQGCQVKWRGTAELSAPSVEWGPGEQRS